MLLLKIQSLSYGHSGVQLATVNRLIDFYNNNIFPVVYEQGSLGASGDLSPLAHLALPLIGLGEVKFNDQRISGDALVRILDTKGNLVLNKAIDVKDGINMYIVDEEISSGIYYININNGNNSTTIVKHIVL